MDFSTATFLTPSGTTDEEKIRESVNIKATNIVLQGLPQNIYNFVNHNEDAKQIWDRVKLLIQCSELTLQEQESKLYDYFDIFTSMLEETIHSYYMRFVHLINDMHMIGMTMKPLRVNTKFVNHLQSEWGKFVTNVNLAKDMHTTNFDHLYAHLRQHEAHENEVHLLSVTQQYHSPPKPQRSYDVPIVQQSQYQPQVVTNSLVVHQKPYQAPALQQSYQAPAIQQPSSTELDSGLVVPSFNPSDDIIANLNKLMAFVSTSFGPLFPQTNNQLRTSSNPKNQATIQDGREIPTPAAFQSDDLDAFDSDYDDIPSAKACSEQPFVDNDPEIDITSDSNIISYEQYLQETKNLVFQNTSSSAQQDELLTVVIEEMSIQVAKCNKVQQENLIVHETLTAELERYKEQVKNFEQRQKFELNDTEKYIDGQLRQVIVDRNAKVADFEKQIHSLKLQLNAIAKSHKTLSTTVECLKKESKQKEDKYLDEVINLQNKNKAVDNVVYKMGQSTQTMHILTKPQAFYDESHKTTLGYQNPFYLSQARWKVPALYDGNTIVKTHAALSITDT
ncbi:hypothetical protein Tco_0657834 [Tanacetum coccineum]